MTNDVPDPYDIVAMTLEHARYAWRCAQETCAQSAVLRMRSRDLRRLAATVREARQRPVVTSPRRP